MKSLISVIVPVYNTQPYLDKCIQSILNQKYQNLEIILVDDGSTDGSSEKCDFYALNDPRIQVIHKQNGGQASARNVALDICHGDYIGFVDSDDWIEPDMYSELLQYMEKYGAKLAVCGRYDAYEGVDEKTIGKCFGENGVFLSYDILPKMAIGQISDFSVCDKLHHRDLWENIRFPEGEIYEDFAVMYKVLLAAETVVLCDKPFYVYFHRHNSTVTSGFREALTAYPRQTRDFISYIMSIYPEYERYAVWTHIKALQSVMIKLLRSDKNNYESHLMLYAEYIQDLKKYRKVWNNDPLFTKTDRILCEVLLHKSIARPLFLLKKSRFG